MEVDKTTCWYDDNVVNEMNRALPSYKAIKDQTFHLTTLRSCIEQIGQEQLNLLDLGCGTGFASEYCNPHNYFGTDLPHIINGCALINYPDYFYKYVDIVNDGLEFINKFDIVLVNGVIDIMQYPIDVLKKVLFNAKDWILIHRQEITEKGDTRVVKNPSYGSKTFHSIINRNQFTDLVERYGYRIVMERQCGFSNWENNGSSFLLKKNISRAINNLDRKLLPYVSQLKDGIFIEVGANNGVRQSVSLYFEEFLNWRGLLIEAIPMLYEECVKNRSDKNVFENYALVGPDYANDIVKLIYHDDSDGLMSSIDYVSNPKETVLDVNAKASTLNKILDKNKKHFSKIDFLVLDIEGGEKEVLQGCDFNRWNIDLILVEEREDTGIEQYLNQWYSRVGKLSEHDFLYKRK